MSSGFSKGGPDFIGTAFSIFLGVFVISILGCGGGSARYASPPSGVSTVEVGNGGATGEAGNNRITLYPTVIDGNYGSVGNLLEGNFIIKIRPSGSTDDQLCTIISLTNPAGSSGQYLSLGMAMDNSGSMSSAEVSDTKSAVKTFIDSMEASDQMGIIKFYSTWEVVATLETTSLAIKTKMKTLVDAITPRVGNLTALYDAIAASVNQVAGGSNPRKAVIALTDGGENASVTYTSTTEIINYARSKNYPVYTVGLALTRNSKDENNLKHISRSTGGIYFYASSSEALSALYSNINTALTSYYTILINAPYALTPGTTYIITVELTNYGGLTSSVTFTITV